ncbi:MAG: protein-L-isoaspartate O-methyltransferase family protein [Burkholderiales bacterium]
MDFEQARFNMVEQQIRPWEVLNQEVLDLLFELKREEFVPEAYRGLAFADVEIPLGYGEVMLAPKLEARILQEVTLESTDRVLEVGTGSGYMAALFSHQAAHVDSVEIVPEFKIRAAAKLAQHGIHNVALYEGDAAQGWSGEQPYDVIVLSGSVPILPERFRDMLAAQGRLFAVIGEALPMKAIRLIRVGKDDYRSEILFETAIPPLRNAVQPQRFVF